MPSGFNNKINDHEKQNLFSAYRRYSGYVRKLEAYIRSNTQGNLADQKFINEYKTDIRKMSSFPWHMEDVGEQEKECFINLVNNKTPDKLNGCYIGIKYNFDNPKSEGTFKSLSSRISLSSDIFMFPSPFEHYIAAFNKDDLLKDTVFIVGGRHKLTYELEDLHENPNITLGEAMESPIFVDRLHSILYVTALYDRYEENIKSVTAFNEAYSSRLLQPIETVILNSMGRLAEISRGILKDMYGYKGAAKAAERNSLIPSADRFYDYINIRHLLHHQCDTLNGYNNFITNLSAKDELSREELLASYQRICNKKQLERVQAYADVLNDFSPLVEHLYPNFFSRRKTESNSKFVKRIKEYVQQNPNEQLILELNYDFNNPKNAQLIKNIKKLFPSAELIDNPDDKLDNVLDEMSSYNHLNIYLQSYQEMESYMSYYCMAHGKNLKSAKAAQFMLEQKAIDQETFDKISFFKDMRNTLSHSFFTTDLAKQVAPTLLEFNDLYTKILKVTESVPRGVLIGDNIFRFTHANGKIVDIDFNNRTIIRADVVSASTKIKEQKAEKSKTPDYIKDLGDGAFIDYNKKKIVFADKSIFYFNSDDHYCWSMRDASGKSAKFLLDKNLKVTKYIFNGKEISVGKGDCINLLPSYAVRLDSQGRLSKYIYRTQNGSNTTTLFNQNRRNTIHLPNGNILDMNDGKPKIEIKQNTNIPFNGNDGR